MSQKNKTKAAIRRLKDLVAMDAPPRMIYRQLARVFSEVNEFCFPPEEAEVEVLTLQHESIQDVVSQVAAAEAGTPFA